ncbi:MAG TPA: GNAT family N-acetyltransferase [Pseudonocardiaceae bacterium]|nr:GNAT family N-acetyltransferase [Pseudonocardiaceae bacterium]
MIRTATTEDVPALVALAAAAYQHYLPRIGRPPAPMTADYAGAVAAGQVWVAEESGELAGLLVLIDFPDHVLVENVAVRPGSQGTGLGRRLLDHAEQHARAVGRSQLRLYTNEKMTENLAYYPRLGYRETHRGEQHGFRRVHFVKDLDG